MSLPIAINQEKITFSIIHEREWLRNFFYENADIRQRWLEEKTLDPDEYERISTRLEFAQHMMNIIDSGVTSLTMIGEQVIMFEDMLDIDREFLIDNLDDSFNKYYELEMLNHFLHLAHPSNPGPW